MITFSCYRMPQLLIDNTTEFEVIISDEYATPENGSDRVSRGQFLLCLSNVEMILFPASWYDRQHTVWYVWFLWLIYTAREQNRDRYKKLDQHNSKQLVQVPFPVSNYMNISVQHISTHCSQSYSLYRPRTRSSAV